MVVDPKPPIMPLSKVFAVVTGHNASEEESAGSAEVSTILGSPRGRTAQYPSG